MLILFLDTILLGQYQFFYLKHRDFGLEELLTLVMAS